MKKTSLKGRMTGLYLAFFLFVLLLVAAVSWTKASQQQVDMIINLANRQHVLIQAITSNALELEQDRDDAREHIVALQAAANTFEQTLLALINGGQAPYLSDQAVDVPAIDNPNIRSRLHQVHHTWDIFRGYLNVMVATRPDHPDFTSAIRSVERLSPQLGQEVEAVSRLSEIVSVQNATRLRWLQGTFFAVALGLLAIGYLITQKSVLTPLRLLDSVAERISRGDLNTPVDVSGAREIEAVAQSLDTIRTQLQISQTEWLKQVENLQVCAGQSKHDLKAGFEFSPDIIAKLDLDPLLSSVVERARSLTGAQVAMLCLSNPKGDELERKACCGEITVPSGRLQSTQNGAAVQVVGADETIAAALDCSHCRFLNACSLEHCLATPLRAGSRTLGALCVCRSGQERFTPGEARALTLLANSVAISIANACLVETAQRYSQLSATLAERERLSAELHDNLAQTLSFLNLKTDQLQAKWAAGHGAVAKSELNNLQAALNEAYGQVRLALSDLDQPLTADDDHSPDPDQALAEELEAYLADFRETAGLPTNLTITDPAALALTPKAHKQLMHIVREALTNVRRHAQAQQVWVFVEPAAEAGWARFIVEDDGRGFDLACNNGANHLGLTIMVARAERSGGHLVIDSVPGAGTKVVASFPLSRD